MTALLAIQRTKPTAPGKNTEQIELLKLGAAGTYVAEYLTVLPPREVLRDKLHTEIETERARIESRIDPTAKECP